MNNFELEPHTNAEYIINIHNILNTTPINELSLVLMPQVLLSHLINKKNYLVPVITKPDKKKNS